MTLLALILAFGAAARLTRLVVVDEFPPTVWLRRRVFMVALARKTAGLDKTKQPLSYSVAVDKARAWPPYKLITCPWCLGFWISLATVTVGYLQPHAWWFLIPAAALTCSYAVGVLARLD